eukprot:CAMPEP_0113964224 /NCGR_PEP_ID=MMETSP0011_2-20120614/7008_1 /TAXON_ID=101924 /ORGANISM="Rhodosorus marinus" /LENGTH=264 /DNA_ID=CAMNT_0000976477 /DNA_START=193 /DNA_END=987 /DNA_ORIENTATION=- /assembly_acc=CAM_ASM_000156
MEAVVETWNASWEGWFGPVHELTKDYPFMQPIVVPVVCIAYLLMVLLGPVLMNGKKLDMKPVMRVYNFFMVCLSFYMGTSSIWHAYQGSYSSVWCVPFAEGKLGIEMARLSWIFTASKVIEFLDTFFMILESRMRQVSFLHVYHHITIFVYWAAITWMAPGSDGYFSLAINSYIHVLMYGYYLLASFGYSPWWKYYITYMQILQFVAFCGQSITVGWMKTCEFPKMLGQVLLFYMISLITLFGNFLVQNKFKKGTKSKKVEKTM